MEMKGLGKKQIIDYASYAAVFLIASLFLLRYLFSSIGSVRLMDFWIDSGEFIEKAMTQLPRLEMFITIPHTLHWNPFGRLAEYFFVRLFGCDNRAFVYAGMLFSFLSIVYVMRIYKEHFSVKNLYFNSLGLIIFVMPIINLNQWEIFTLYCNFSFMFRIFIYYIIFGLLDKILHKNEQKKCLCASIYFGIINVIVILFMSQAYFLGLIAAEMVLIIIDRLINRNSKKVQVYFTVLISALSGFGIYYITLQRSALTISENVVSLGRAADYIQGILVMLGSTIVPQTIALDNISICYEIGIVIMILALIAVWLFFHMKVYEKTYFPLACLVYAFSSIIVIMIGRIDLFGLNSLTSSRYVVETTVGLLGIIQIYWYCFCKALLPIKKRLPLALILLGMAVMMCWTNKAEMKAGPYRKAYNDVMEELALNIDNVSDEQLEIFQSAPNNVREGIAAMKKYHLLLWRE